MSTKKLLIGLTGGIGCGKTTVADAFTQLGAVVISADTIARSLVLPESDNLNKIVNRFGDDILKDGMLNRAELQKRIFSDTHAKHWLEALLHPQIRKQMLMDVAKTNAPYIILDIPLLLEVWHDHQVDRICIVDCLPEQQRERVMLRDRLPAELIDSIMQQQVSRSERLQKANDLIDNSGTMANTLKQVKALHEAYLAGVGG